MRARGRLLQLQKDIHGSLKLEAERLVGRLPEAIVRYERTYAADFKKCSRRSEASSRQKLSDRMRSADVTFIADYHTLGQAQRTALRLVQDVHRAGERWLLGLEFVPSHRQAELDAYQSGVMDADTFLQKIRYREEWGFPWGNYAPLLDWARRNGVRMLALNRPRELPLWRSRVDGDDLRERDLWAAGVIVDAFLHAGDSFPPPHVVVLYGELHVGASHLPAMLDRVARKSLGRKLDWISVHQNNDSLYWKLAGRGAEHSQDVLKLNSRNFHVISSTPWNKLQSLVSWAEGVGHGTDRLPQSGTLHLKSEAGGSISSHPEADDDEFLCDLESDALSRMQSYGDAMASFLRLPPPEFERLAVQSVYSADFVDSLRSDTRLLPAERRLVSMLVRYNARFFVPRTGLVYLGTPSVNGAAELAAIVLAKGHSPLAPFFGETIDSFFQSVMDHAFGFFGSLLVNPRRKCDLPEDHLQRYLELRGQQGRLSRSGGDYWHERQARLFTLTGLEEQARFLERTRRFEAELLPGRLSAPGIAGVVAQVLQQSGVTAVHSRFALWLASRYLGQILGKLLHRALLREDVSTEQVRELAWQASDRRWRPAEIRYWEWVSAVASQPLPISKRQTI